MEFFFSTRPFAFTFLCPAVFVIKTSNPPEQEVKPCSPYANPPVRPRRRLRPRCPVPRPDRLGLFMK